ncbi:MAG: tRNA uridine-5-carboxymethylaminomethyl(34) synthesis GTPase MnmE [Prochlorothrix sp.]
MAASTIAAIATAIVPQQGSVGIVRLSGPEAFPIARILFQVPGTQPWDSHRILYGFIQDPTSQENIDEALLLLMQAPRSYTREDVVEFHCHGGVMVVQRVLQLCLEQGATLAQPGEFTLRAFLNGRLDLTQAESIADLVGAQSPQAAQTALAGVQGKLAQPIRQLRSECLDILAEIEAYIDFEDDLPPLDENAVQTRLGAVLAQVQAILATADRGQLLRTGLKVAIVGQPNVGKSSLLNAWSQSDRAIVTDLPGTTRDVVESQLVVGGIPIQVVDTAGIRETEDQVEQLGVARSRQAAQQADLVLFTVDASQGWTSDDQAIYQEVQDRSLILVCNKIDLIPNFNLQDFNFRHFGGFQSLGDSHGHDNPHHMGNSQTSAPRPGSGSSDFASSDFASSDFASSDFASSDFASSNSAYPQDWAATVALSASLPEGIDRLEAAILATVHQGQVQAINLDFAINQRQAAALTRARQSLEQVQDTLRQGLPLDLWTIDLRGAIQALGEITGENLTESMLDRIFSRFCIGK